MLHKRVVHHPVEEVVCMTTQQDVVVQDHHHMYDVMKKHLNRRWQIARNKDLHIYQMAMMLAHQMLTSRSEKGLTRHFTCWVRWRPILKWKICRLLICNLSTTTKLFS